MWNFYSHHWSALSIVSPYVLCMAYTLYGVPLTNSQYTNLGAGSIVPEWIFNGGPEYEGICSSSVRFKHIADKCIYYRLNVKTVKPWRTATKLFSVLVWTSSPNEKEWAQCQHLYIWPNHSHQSMLNNTKTNSGLPRMALLLCVCIALYSEYAMTISKRQTETSHSAKCNEFRHLYRRSAHLLPTQTKRCTRTISQGD